MNFKKKTLIFAAINLLVFLNNAFILNASSMDYRLRWQKCEEDYNKEFQARLKERQKKQDSQLYLKLGKEYLTKKEYVLAAVCFKNIIELEQDTKKEFTPEAEEFMRGIEKNIQSDIQQDLSSIFKEDWSKRKKGVGLVLKRRPPNFFAQLDRRKEEELRRRIKEEKKEMEDEKNKRKRKIKEEILRRGLEIKKDLQRAWDFLRNKNYRQAIAQAEEILMRDENNQKAKEIKNIALTRIKKQECIDKKRASQQSLRLERKKRKEELRLKKAQEMEARKQEIERKIKEKKNKKQALVYLKRAKKYFQKNQFQKALVELNLSLALEPDNIELKLYLEQIKSSIKKTIEELSKIQKIFVE